jgi:PAS domain S-box-containing protein
MHVEDFAVAGKPSYEELEQRVGALEREAVKRTQAEEALRQTEERLQLAVESGNMGLWDRDFRTKKIFWSDKLYDLLGRDPEGPEITGDTFFDYIHPDDRSQVLDHFESCLQEGEDFQDEFRVVREDGTTVWMASIGRVYRDESGAPLRMAGVNYDISERKQAEGLIRQAKRLLENQVEEKTTELTEALEDLSRSEKRFRLIAETVQDVFWMVEPDSGQMLYVNPAYETVWGRTTKSLVQDPSSFFQTLRPDDRERVQSARQDLLGEARKDLEYGILRPDGSLRWIREQCYPIREESGYPALVICVARDITERKERQEQLRFLSARLLEAQETERRNVAHELHDGIGGNLLGIKMGVERNIEKLRSYRPAADTTTLEEILDLVTKTMREVNEIQQNLRPQILDHLGLAPALRSLCREFEHMQKDIHVTLELQKDGADVPEDLKIVIYRISQEALTNVAKHSGAENATLSMKYQKDAIQLTIKDDGCGFDMEEVFKPENIRRGIGLASMRERCELSGGTFSVGSKEGEGVTVRCNWSVNT